MPNIVVQRVSCKKAYPQHIVEQSTDAIVEQSADDVVEKANTTVHNSTVVLVYVNCAMMIAI